MKITNQLSENEFVIDLGDTPVDTKNTHVMVAHDYVLFKNYGIISIDDLKYKKSIYGKHSFASNVVSIPIHCQVGINYMGGVILPMLNERDEMKPEHYTHYLYKNNSVTFFNKDGEKMIAIPIMILVSLKPLVSHFIKRSRVLKIEKYAIQMRLRAYYI